MTRYQELIEAYKALPKMPQAEEIKAFEELMAELAKESRKETIKVFLIGIFCLAMLGLTVAPLVVR